MIRTRAESGMIHYYPQNQAESNEAVREIVRSYSGLIIQMDDGRGTPEWEPFTEGEIVIDGAGKSGE